MPRTVDHDQRRAEIADGLVRVAARDGLHAVTMRSVAAEAGVSLRLVQYYFQSKAELLHGALRRLERQSRQRWQARLAGLPQPAPAREVVRAFLAEALPTDEASRTFHLLGSSYAVLAMTDPVLAAQPFVAGLNHLQGELTETLRAAANANELASGVDPEHEAARLIALNHGIGSTVLVGQCSLAAAQAVLDYHLDRIFRTGEG